MSTPNSSEHIAKGIRTAFLLSLLVLYSIPQHAAAARACEESGYCSTGISKHWIGDIKESAQFRAMLEAVTFKKELVLTIFQENESDQLWVDQALQLHWELEGMGYAHHIYVTDNNEACQKLNSKAQISCVWDSSELPGHVLSGEVKLWHNRWKLIARGSRLGYNIMSIDTDFMWIRDPYVHFKSAPFKDIQMLGVPEGGSVYNNNGGFMYVQNARPDGPVSWVFKQVAMSTLRRADDDFKFMSTWTGGTHNCLTFDQSIISDALAAAAVGRMIFPSAMLSCKMKGTFQTRAGNTLTAEQAKHNMESLIVQHVRTGVKTVRPEKSWLDKIKVKFVSEFDSRLHYGNITVPNLAWGFPDELGGRFAPVEPGKLSQAFTQQLRDDCPDCPWWPERRPLPQGEDPLIKLLGPKFDSPNVNNDNAWIYYEESVPQEVFAQIPSWLACSLGNVRRGWVLGRNAPLQGPMVLGHVHAWHMQTHRAHKAMIRKVLGRYNWTLGSEVATAAGLPNPYGLRRDVKKILALSPDIDLSRTRSWEEFSSIIVGMIQVAFLSNRILLMPQLPCQTAWVHDPNTVKDPEAGPKLCIAPTFWRTPYRYPLPVTVAVDERGELVGGWARRLRAQLTSGGTAMQQPVVPPTILEPDTSDAERSQGSSLGSWSGPRRGLSQTTPDIPDDWWEKQRYMLVMPQLWDPSCTKDLLAIIGPEFFHWLKHTDVGKTVQLQPTKANTALSVSPSAAALKLQPQPPPGGDSAAVPAGSVVPISPATGWSLRDVQAALSAAQVIEHMKLFDDQPLVYMGHPVMVVHSTTNPTEDAAMHLQDRTAVDPPKGSNMIQHRLVGVSGSPVVTPDEHLSAINYYMRRKKCKAMWTKDETHDGTVVDLSHGVRSVLVDGLIQPLQPSQ